MSKRRRPKLGLNLAEINAEDSLEQSFMVQSDAFVNADIRVSSQGLEINQQGSSSSSSSSNAAPMTPIVEGKQSSMPSSTKEKKFIGDLNPNQLETIKELGRGASSYVQLVRDKKTNKSMALKVINVFDKNMRDMLLKEINTLYKCDCHALVKFHGCFYREGKISVAIEYMNLGSLDQVMDRFAPQGIREPELAAITFQCLWGLAYLKHEHRLHRDIKPQNILLNSDGRVKLTDFGISKELENSIGKCMTIVGTFKYMSPERILAEKYSYSSDIWSMGLVLIECATNAYPYSGIHSMIEMAQTVTEAAPPTLPPQSGFTEQFHEFVDMCLKKDPSERPVATKLLGNEWLKSHQCSTMKSATNQCKGWVDELLGVNQQNESGDGGGGGSGGSKKK